MRAVCRLLLLGMVTGCSAGGNGARDQAPPAGTTPPGAVAAPEDPARTLTPAPWSGEPLAAGEVPEVYLQQWRRAENRESCAPIAPASLGAGAGAEPRAATFSDGWAVAYDQPELRSAFGVAGTGVDASQQTYSEWPHSIEWADGSSAGYGPEGGSGPNQLAYLRIEGQGCLYNVWSRLGRGHLEGLLQQLRFIAVR